MKQYIPVILLLLFGINHLCCQQVIPNLLIPGVQHVTKLNPNNSTFKGGSAKRLDSVVVIKSGGTTERKTEFHYNLLFNITEENVYNRIDSTMPWLPDYSIQYSYNNDNELSERIEYGSWSTSNNTFQSARKWEYIYNNSLITEVIVSNFYSQSWILFGRELISYNSSGFEVQKITQDYFGGQWNNSNKKVRTYSNGLLMDITDYYYNNNYWGPQYLWTYTYNSSGELIQLNGYTNYGIWQDQIKYDFIRSPGKIDIIYWYYWNYVWEIQSKSEEFYDTQGNLTNQTNSSYDIASQTYKLDGQFSYTYDNSYPYANLVTTLSEKECKHLLLTSFNQYYDSQTGQLDYTEDGTYYWSDVLILPTGTDFQSACSSYTWIDGITYTTSTDTTTYTIPGGAANGCDSLVILNLTINTPSTSIDIQSACGSYTWIDGVTYTTSTDTATYTIPGGDANGCDSLVILNLTINTPSTSIDIQSACGNYTWIDGITYTSSNNMATYTIVGGDANGCDSTVSLDLTINQVSDLTTTINSPMIIANNINATAYQWLDCNAGMSILQGETGNTFTATMSGDYAVQLTENGCIDTTACVTIILSTVEESSFNENIWFFPNPASNNISFNLPKSKNKAHASLFNANGSIVLSRNISNNSLQLPDLPAGFYTIQVVIDDNVFNSKLILK